MLLPTLRSQLRCSYSAPRSYCCLLNGLLCLCTCNSGDCRPSTTSAPRGTEPPKNIILEETCQKHNCR